MQIEGIMDKKNNQNTPQKYAFPCGKRITCRGFIFQQDNDPKHTSKFCQNYIVTKEKQKELKYIWNGPLI